MKNCLIGFAQKQYSSRMQMLKGKCDTSNTFANYPEEITDSQLCEICEVTRQTTRNWRIGGLPYRKRRKRIYYDREKLEAWLYHVNVKTIFNESKPGQLTIMKATDGDKVFTITWGEKPMMSVFVRVEDLLDELKEEQYGRG